MPFDILLFAAIAAFFVWKLRQTLGTRTGEERERENPFAAPTDSPRDVHNLGPDTVIDSTARDVPLAEGQPRRARHPETSVAGGLAQIEALDSAFDEKAFLTAARQAYTMIVEAFASGDRETLRLLLSPEIYRGFGEALEARTARGESMAVSVKKILVAEISAVKLDGSQARVAVDFTSEQTSVTRNQAGETVDGDPVQPIEVAEAWIFERDLASRDPAWQLAATRPL